LVCVECGRETTAPEKGWQAVLAGGVEDELEVAVYCPDCAEREFGEDEAG
jgi:DNA-directed RNA polymerase subunit RPC12/RpoP